MLSSKCKRCHFSAVYVVVTGIRSSCRLYLADSVLSDKSCSCRLYHRFWGFRLMCSRRNSVQNSPQYRILDPAELGRTYTALHDVADSSAKQLQEDQSKSSDQARQVIHALLWRCGRELRPFPTIRVAKAAFLRLSKITPLITGV